MRMEVVKPICDTTSLIPIVRNDPLWVCNFTHDADNDFICTAQLPSLYLATEISFLHPGRDNRRKAVPYQISGEGEDVRMGKFGKDVYFSGYVLGRHR